MSNNYDKLQTRIEKELSSAYYELQYMRYENKEKTYNFKYFEGQRDILLAIWKDTIMSGKTEQEIEKALHNIQKEAETRAANVRLTFMALERVPDLSKCSTRYSTVFGVNVY